MTGGIMPKHLFLISSVFIAQPVLAQDDEIVIVDERVDPTTITVTATGTGSGVESTGQPVTVIGQAEIDAVQGADVTRVLRRAPGVTITRNGPPGAFTGVRVRGAAAEPLLV